MGRSQAGRNTNNNTNNNNTNHEGALSFMPNGGDPRTRDSSNRLGVYIVLIMIGSLVFALTPSREQVVTIAKFGTDSNFELKRKIQDDHHRFPLRMNLNSGYRYVFNDTTMHLDMVFAYKEKETTNIKKKKKKQQSQANIQLEKELVQTHQFKNHISLEVRIKEDQRWSSKIKREGDLAIQIKILDFIGFERISKHNAHPQSSYTQENNNQNEDDDKRQEMNSKKSSDYHKDREELKYTEAFAALRKATKGLVFDALLKADGTFREMKTGKIRKTILHVLHLQGLLPMELEYVVFMNDQVFRANGASFNPNGKNRIHVDIVAMSQQQGQLLTKNASIDLLGDGCRFIRDKETVKHLIVLVKRGGCSFHRKAFNFQRMDAAGIIVIDDRPDGGEMNESPDDNEDTTANEEEEEEEEENNDVDHSSDTALHPSDYHPQTYMDGYGRSKIVSVLITKSAGELILKKISESDNGRLGNSGIKGGLDAVYALHHAKTGKNIHAHEELHKLDDDNDDEEEDNYVELDAADEKDVFSSLSLVQEDGLYDIIGINYVIDETLTQRFNIFPENPVTIGDSWHRERVVYTEGFKYAAAISEDFKIESGKKDDENSGLLLTIALDHLETPINTEEEEKEKKESTKKKIGVNTVHSNPLFVRPSAYGQQIKVSGSMLVHAETGLLLSGSSTSTMEWDEDILMSSATGDETVRTGHHELTAVSEMSSEMIPI